MTTCYLLKWRDVTNLSDQIQLICRRLAMGGLWAGAGRWAIRNINPDFVQNLSMSKVCPIYVQFPILFFQKLKMWNLRTFWEVQSMSSICPVRKNAVFSNLLDSVWTRSRFMCPISVQVLCNRTDLWQGFDWGWTVTRQTLYMTHFWTDIGQGFDKAWTNVGFPVQSLSNQPKATCTQMGKLWSPNFD